MGMVGLRDLLVVAPAASFHHQQVDQSSILSDHHHHYHHLHQAINTSNTSLGVGVGVGVFPILTTAPCLPPNIVEDNETANNSNSNSRRGIQLWQQPSMVGSGVSTGAGSGVAAGFSSSGVIGGTTCQDCGNQAKKDCSHRRCRTCCKSRGFECSTHVKSTWVPAERRRERQIVAATTASSASTSSAKKPRVIPSQTTTTSTSNNTPARSFDTSSSHQDASFKENLPGQVRAPAFFKCVRVTSLEDGDAEYAYQAVVKIGGHVFKGLLQDHGIEGRVGIPNISELQLGGGAGDSGGSGVRNVTTSSMLEPSDVYAVSSSGMLGGTNFSNPIS